MRKHQSEKTDYKKQAEDNLAGWQRAKADYENLVKRVSKERSEIIQSAGEAIIAQIIPVLDNFQNAVNHLPKELEKHDWVRGIMYIRKQLEDVLTANNVSSYGKVGDKFDPTLHEAIDGQGEKISEVVQLGYEMNDNIIRIAKVKVN